MMIYVLIILGLWFALSIFIQKPKNESLGNAIGNTYKSKFERLLVLHTYFVFILLCIAIYLVK